KTDVLYAWPPGAFSRIDPNKNETLCFLANGIKASTEGPGIFSLAPSNNFLFLVSPRKLKTSGRSIHWAFLPMASLDKLTTVDRFEALSSLAQNCRRATFT